MQIMKYELGECVRKMVQNEERKSCTDFSKLNLGKVVPEFFLHP